MSTSHFCLLFCLLVSISYIEGKPTDITFDSVVNRTVESITNIYNPIANHTKDIVDSISNGIKNYTITDDDVNKIKNCSIVVGGALAGAVIGIIAIIIVVPLALCLLGFTCWGIMAGSAAACCQSGIGNVPAGSCFSCFQSLGAGGGGWTYLIIACVVGIPIGLYVGGLYTESHFHCFTSG